MLKLTNDLLNSRDFIQSLNKLRNATGMDVKTMYGVSKLASKVDVWVKQGRDIYSKIVREHAEMDAQGSLVPEMTADGKPIPGSFKIPAEKKEAFQKACDEFINQDFEVKLNKLDVNRLGTVALSPQDLLNLEPILELEGLEEA